ncbi:hypothetical protein PGTUg99_013494 [Puccinia graminis f. sp. tritici]|uniref:Uncharacterized protein n=1 Tax=Puccinia graminis f. sp. tritici TaxID=56615 RepID=A0A5B0RHQ3_PUCGR|nr:hypothetical protein PGTUg99_013494 [Puccinia graminis f. sp. tritici]
MKLSKIIAALGLLQGYHSMERVDEAAHTQRVAEQLIPGTASKAGKADQVGPAVRRKSQEVSTPGPQLVSSSNGDHAVINAIDDSSDLRPSDLESKGPKADSRSRFFPFTLLFILMLLNLQGL